ESLLQLARARTWSGRHMSGEQALVEAEGRYMQLLSQSALQKNSMLKAEVLKELADNFRFRGADDESRRYFDQAREAYRAVPARLALEDPPVTVEVALNVAYCERRLGNEEQAYQEFVLALGLAHRQRNRRAVAYSCLQLA